MADLSHPHKTPADPLFQADGGVGASLLHRESRLSGILPFLGVSASFAPLYMVIIQGKREGLPVGSFSRIFFLFVPGSGDNFSGGMSIF